MGVMVTWFLGGLPLYHNKSPDHQEAMEKVLPSPRVNLSVPLVEPKAVLGLAIFPPAGKTSQQVTRISSKHGHFHCKYKNNKRCR